MDLLTVNKRDGEKFLRRKTVAFDFPKYPKKEIDELIKTMRAVMKRENGIGLAANQIGMNVRVFVAQVENKFYSIFNPDLEKISEQTINADEGCLSVPMKFGSTPRAEKVVLKGQDKNGRPVKIKAWGLLARVFQHEVDHLNGKLFIDTAKEVHEYKPDDTKS